MHGKPYNEDDTSGPDRSFSLVYVLPSCWDFAPTRRQRLRSWWSREGTSYGCV